MGRYIIIIGLTVSLAVAVSGCTTTMLQENWGSSYILARNSQIANPDASKSLEPVVGLDGMAAQRAMDKYQRSFKDQAQGTGNTKSPQQTINFEAGSSMSITSY